MTTKFILPEFQSAVFKDASALSAVYTIASFSPKGKQRSIGYDSGVFDKRPIFRFFVAKLFSFLAKKTNGGVLEKSDFIAKQADAVRILRERRIQKLLCRQLRLQISNGLLLEAQLARIVSILTESLTSKDIATQFSLEADTRLFALMALEIQRKGIAKYCKY